MQDSHHHMLTLVIHMTGLLGNASFTVGGCTLSISYWPLGRWFYGVCVLSFHCPEGISRAGCHEDELNVGPVNE